MWDNDKYIWFRITDVHSLNKLINDCLYNIIYRNSSNIEAAIFK